MNIKKRRGGYLATAEGVKKLKEAKRIKKYTYENIQEKAQYVTLDQIKRLFNPQWGNGQYKIGEEALEAICTVLDLQPEDIVGDWYPVEISTPETVEEESRTKDESKIETPNTEVLRKIKQVAKSGGVTLDLSDMGITELPAEIGQLTNLTVLNLGSNKLDRFPAEIGQLTNLTVLNLGSNKLDTLPAKIKQLTNLTKLYLSSNNLKSLPAEIGQLTNLTVLDLHSNSLKTLPAEIGQLTNLTVLDLSSNSLSSLPAEIGQLNNLTVLDLYSNSLKTLPAEIGQLNNLTVLDLYSNSLKTLPAEIGQPTKLTELNLGFNQLNTLPAEIGQLTKLTKLNLGFNQLNTLPAEIGQLTKLTKLNINHNFLSSLSPQIGQLKELQRLDLDHNKLDRLPPQIGQLDKLERLALNNNDLKSLPPQIGQLNKLDELYLDHNDLKSLPPQIGQLTKLEGLHLENNYLSSLPPTIDQLTTNLTRLHLESNSLPIPPEILGKYREPHIIIKYCLSLQNNQQKSWNKGKKSSVEQGSVGGACLNEAKMLLIGQGSVGKTCLKERLIRNQYDPRRNKTDGIDIETWNIEIDEREIQVNVWDFGGQEIMHSTHQFFLTKRSLYLLVVDATLGEEENRIEYWLKIIQSFGKDSPVILVGNKADQHPLDIDQRGLKQKYPQIKAFMETSCTTGTGIEELQKVVTKEISQLEHIDDQLPLTWFDIKKQLEDLDKDYISYDRYESICETEGVKEEDNQSILIQFLHDLGVVLNFKDDDRLQDTHVLNPEWVTNGVYKILNDRDLILKHKGILDREMLSRILDPHRYPQNKQMFIIDMMRKFELCFDVEPDKRFLIPDILPKEQPRNIGEWENALAFEYHYHILPGSIISRFIVRMNHYIYQKTYWRSGVVLEKEGNTALVKADREDRKIIIRVKGQKNTRRDLLAVIRFQCEYIHKTIPGIILEEKVPFIDKNHEGKEMEIVLDYQELLGLEAMGKSSIVIGKLKKEIPLKPLLDGIEEESKRKEEDRDNDYD